MKMQAHWESSSSSSGSSFYLSFLLLSQLGGFQPEDDCSKWDVAKTSLFQSLFMVLDIYAVGSLNKAHHLLSVLNSKLLSLFNGIY